ncbi:MAG TPA: DMT family transporter [Chloroflexota bacterium]
MRYREVAALLTLAALWGGSFLAIRLAAPAFGPFALIDVRVLLAAAALLLYAGLRRQRITVRPRWRGYLLLGAVNAAAPFTLIAYAELQLTASLAAILNATTPLFAALIAAIWLRETLTARKLGGLVLGLLGVALVVGWSSLPLTAATFLAAGASLLAAVCYALGGVMVKARFSATPSMTLAVGQQLGAGIVLLPLAVSHLPGGVPSAAATLAMLYLALAGTALAYLLYFHLVARVGPSNTLSVTLLVPVFGVLWSVLFLAEPISASTIVGLAVVLAGVLLATWQPRPSPNALPYVEAE